MGYDRFFTLPVTPIDSQPVTRITFTRSSWHNSSSRIPSVSISGKSPSPLRKNILTRAPLKKTYRGNYETPGEFVYADFNSDIVDMDAVIKYLKSEYGYVVTMMICHSKAAVATMRYLCTHEEVAASVTCFVNVSGRYRMVCSTVMDFEKVRLNTIFQRIDRKRCSGVLSQNCCHLTLASTHLR